jgi:hypothetical protein
VTSEYGTYKFLLRLQELKKNKKLGQLDTKAIKKKHKDERGRERERESEGGRVLKN